MVEALTDSEVEQVLAYVADEGQVSMRNQLIVHLLLYTTVRVSELVSIKLTDIDFIDHTLIVRRKGGKVREIVIRKDLMAFIQYYIEQKRSTLKFVHHQIFHSIYYIILSSQKFSHQVYVVIRVVNHFIITTKPLKNNINHRRKIVFYIY